MTSRNSKTIPVGASASAERLSALCTEDLHTGAPLRLVGIGRRSRELAHQALEDVPFTILIEDELGMTSPEESVVKISTPPSFSRRELKDREWTIRARRLDEIGLVIEQQFGAGPVPQGPAVRRGVLISPTDGGGMIKIVLKPGRVDYVPVAPGTF